MATRLADDRIRPVPCKRSGEPKTKAWLIAIGEPVIGNSAGEYTSAPQPIGVSGFGKCKGGKKKK